MKTKVFGSLFMMMAVFMLLACMVSAYYCLTEGEDDFFAIFIPTVVMGVLGWMMWRWGKKRSHVGEALSRRDSFLVVGVVWVVFSLFGMVPYLIYGTTEDFATAFFETMSGFTSTGATALINIDTQPHGILFWRCMTQWLGGLGIIVFSFALIPIYELRNTNVFAAEVTGIGVDKLQPRIQDTARRLLIIYSLLTILCALTYKMTSMNVYDAICHAMTTISTGGFSTHQASIAYYNSPRLEYIACLFMFVGSLNFSLIYYASISCSRIFWKNEEFRWFTFYIVGAVLFFFLLMSIIIMPSNYEKAFRSCLFHVISIASSTGYQASNFDYVAWGEAFWVPTMILMFVGACAGSTGGGVKMIRIIVCMKNMVNEFRRQLRPRAIYNVRLSGKVLPEGKVSHALAFMFIYFVLFVVSTIFLTTIGIDTDTALGSSLSCLSNIGPAMGVAGPSSTYATMPDVAKIVLSFIMLIGRLELYTLLFLFLPSFWNKK